MQEVSSQHDFRPTANWDRLKSRAELLRRSRQFFDDRGFLEVETPLLSADTVVDRHLDPFEVEIRPGGHSYWLQTSPEFGMKRLLASGGKAIYQITRAFRRDEIGPLHNPEFTMIEWYRVDDDMDQGMSLLSDFCEMLLSRGTARRLSYGEAFEQHVGIDPHTADTSTLANAARQIDLIVPESLHQDDRDGWLELLAVERIQPHLGYDRPTILYDYPASQAALARIRPTQPPVAERFELFVDGIELANGYHELTDPDEFHERTVRTNRRRRSDHRAALPEENRLTVAMRSGLPPSTGVAAGFDRFVMLATGARELNAVIAFPFDRA